MNHQRFSAVGLEEIQLGIGAIDPRDRIPRIDEQRSSRSVLPTGSTTVSRAHSSGAVQGRGGHGGRE